jgi:hypothetical protein
MSLAGFQVRVTALVTLHNLCIWINRSLGRGPRAFLTAWTRRASELTPRVGYLPPLIHSTLETGPVREAMYLT